MIFASDNWAGASEKVMAALAEAARRGGPAYGDDLLTKLVERRFAEIFERKVAVFFVATGTAANALALAAYAQPGGIASPIAKPMSSPTNPGSAELFGGAARWSASPAKAARSLRRTLERGARPLSRRQRPYRPADRGQHQPADRARHRLRRRGNRRSPRSRKRRGVAVHMDGARFANAVAGA